MEEKVSVRRLSLFTIFLTFAKIGLMMFGGGMAMFPMLSREIIEKRGWASEQDLVDYFAISQCTPGIIAINTATFIGHKKRGVIGGIVATLGIVFPSLVIITVLAGLITTFSENIYVQKAFMGIRACVCALIISAIIKLWKSSVKSNISFILFLASLAVSILLNISPIIIVLVSAAIGIIFSALSIKVKGLNDE